MRHPGEPPVPNEPSALPPRPRGDAPLPLSFAQERLWVLEQLRPGSARHHVPLAVRLEGRCDATAL
ncbi:MAG TPA: hypothetical protein VK447_10260, partial [Myxococcaceae bacterium]|nr:hypothetical protein [Myxococcaceae bacterium]